MKISTNTMNGPCYIHKSNEPHKSEIGGALHCMIQGPVYLRLSFRWWSLSNVSLVPHSLCEIAMPRSLCWINPIAVAVQLKGHMVFQS